MRSIIVLLFITLGLHVAAYGQNLIQNPGFEIGQIPTTYDQVSYATGWNRNCGRIWSSVDPNGPGIPGSPDLFDSMSSSCLYQTPKNKWGIRSVRSGGRRYVGFNSYSNNNGPKYYGETVEGTLTAPLLTMPYRISFWTAAIDKNITDLSNPTCSVPYITSAPSPENRVEVVLRKGNSCSSGKVVYLSAPITSTDWHQHSGQFTLSAADVAVGYDRIEFRMVQWNYTGVTSNKSHAIFLDDTELTAEIPTLPCCKCLGEVTTLDISTGQGGGAVDPYWTVNNGQPTYITPPHPAWWSSLPPAKWIQPVASPLPNQFLPLGNYVHRFKFQVPACTIPRDIRMEGNVAGDDDILAFIFGGSILQCPSCFNTPTKSLPFNIAVNPGVNAQTLTVVVKNNGGATGMLLNGRLVGQCKKE